jgi:hypothetical protein
MTTITQSAWNSWEDESKFGHNAQMEDLALGRASGLTLFCISSKQPS